MPPDGLSVSSRDFRKGTLGGRAGHKLVPPAVGFQRHKVMAGTHGERAGPRVLRSPEQAAARGVSRAQNPCGSPSRGLPGTTATLGRLVRQHRPAQKAGVPQNLQRSIFAGRIASRDAGAGVAVGVLGSGTRRVARRGREAPAFCSPRARRWLARARSVAEQRRRRWFSEERRMKLLTRAAASLVAGRT